MQAIWENQILAESSETIIIENNHYFPQSSINAEYFTKSDTTTVCPWKGTASYYTILVNGKENIDAAWYYSPPKAAAKEIADHVAFWRGVDVVE